MTVVTRLTPSLAEELQAMGTAARGAAVTLRQAPAAQRTRAIRQMAAQIRADAA